MNSKRSSCQLPTQSHRMLARLQAETTAKEMGAKSWRQVLAIRWRISTSEAGRRLDEAALFGPRRTLTGEPLDPVLPCTALAQARGMINGEHVKVVRKAMDRIPPAIDTLTRAQIEIDLVRTAIGVGPKELKDNAERTLFLLDQDGPEPDDAERARRRGVSMGPQGSDKMRPFRGNLSPEASAIYEAIYAKWAAPGMCNPADENPCVSGTPTQAQIDGDQRSLAQRQHDALVAVGRSVLESGELGQHNGLPTSIIIRTTLQDLESRAGVGVSGGGTVIPIATSSAWPPTPTITSRSSTRPPGRRWTCSALAASLPRHSGSCSSPATVAAPNPAAPCPPMAAKSTTPPVIGPTTARPTSTNWVLRADPTTAWSDPAAGPPGSTTTTTSNGSHRQHLDTGQARVNDYHRPERLLRPPDDEPGGPEPNAA